MRYRIQIESRARRDLRALPTQILRRVDATIMNLENDPMPQGSARVRGRIGDGWRVRVGDYRILYTVDHEHMVVTIYRVRHRREVYR